MASDKLSSYQGSLLGLAVGDALGAAVEFMPPGSFEPITDMRDSKYLPLKAGQWTDDTSMALCNAMSLLEKGGFCPEDQMKKFVKWFEKGYMSCIGYCFDIGQTTRYAIERFKETGEPFYKGKSRPSNGSLMKLAPIPLFFSENPKIGMDLSGESSLLTHNTQEAYDACRYFGGLIIGAINGVSKDKLLSPMYAPVDDYWKENELNPNVRYVAEGSFKNKNPPEIRASSNVSEILEAALWAFNKSYDFEDGCLLAVNLGNDADTVGAIYGQIAGAYYGVSMIPRRWLCKLQHADKIKQIASDLLYVKVCEGYKPKLEQLII